MKLKNLTVQITSGVLCLGPVMASAANLVANPNFDADVAGWTLDSTANGGSFTLDSGDGSPVPPSGFLQSGGTPNTIVRTDCIVVSGLQNIDMHADIKPSFQDPMRNPEIMAHTFSDSTCSSAMPTYIFTDACIVLSAPGWERCSTVNHPLPPGTQSVVVSISVSIINANFDNIGFGPTGTVPVTLQSFNID
ncbi:MAG: hypothetical protein ABIW82_10695 [Dokdonella sp.]